MAGKKRVPTDNQKIFVKEYVKDRNASRAARVAYPTAKHNVATAIGYENLRKPYIRAEIETLLLENGISLSEIVHIHKRNMVQDKHLPTSQKAVDTAYNLLGLTDKEKDSNTLNVAFVIEK